MSAKKKESFDDDTDFDQTSLVSIYKQVDKDEQMSLFSNFYATQDQTRTLPTYDIIPKFILSNTRSQKKVEIRTFSSVKIGEKKVKVDLTPAIIETPDGAKAIFPGVREELIERALRFMAVQENVDLCLEEKTNEKGNRRITVTFTLYSLRKQMAKDGHDFKLSQIREGLEVMRKCDLKVTGDLDQEYVGILSGPLLSISDQLTTKELDADGKRTAFRAVFHPLATQSILNQDYYLMKHSRLMKLRLPLARWIANRLNAKYRQASKKGWLNGDGAGYRLTLRQILEESGIIVEERLRDNIERVRLALKELKESSFLNLWNPFIEKPTYESTKGRSKLVNMEWILYPSDEFVEDIIEGNIEQKRLRGIKHESLKKLENLKLNSINIVGTKRESRKIKK